MPSSKPEHCEAPRLARNTGSYLQPAKAAGPAQLLLLLLVTACSGTRATTSLPLAPTLTATAVSDGVALSWSAVTGATRYTLYRSTTAGAQGVALATDLTTTIYADNSVIAGTTYQYEVTASNSAGESKPSNQVAVTITQATPTTYSVTYNGNGNTGGSAPVDNTQYKQGQTVTVLGNTGNLTKSSLAFTGWNTAADGSGTGYAPNSTFTITANTTLYAQWTSQPTYTVTYNGNGNTGGSVPVDNTQYLQGQTVTVLGNSGNLTNSSLAFTGWNAAADGSGTAYAPNSTFTITANTILYAQWTSQPTYTVTYNGNGNTGGSVPVDNTQYVQGQTVTVLGNIGNLTNTNYAFAGWNTLMDGRGTAYAAGSTFSITTNTTLYAQWTATYTVTYNGNTNTGGTAPVDNTKYTQGQTVTVLGSGSLTKTNYIFTGWQDERGTPYAPASTFSITANTTLYAQWTLVPTYTVTYSGNGNTGGTAPIDSGHYTQGQTVTVMGSGSLVRNGYAFANWNTVQSGGTSGTAFAPGATFVMGNANVTLYAQWSKGVIGATCAVAGDCNSGLYCNCAGAACESRSCGSLACLPCNYVYQPSSGPGSCFPVNGGITTSDCMGTLVCGSNATNNAGMCVLVNGQTCVGSLANSTCENSQCCAASHCDCNDTPTNCATGDPQYFICGS